MSSTPDQLNVIGKRFAEKYYETFVAKPGAKGLGYYYGAKSKHIFMQCGQPDYVVQGTDKVELFMAQMKYHECTLKIESVDTIKVHPNWLTVLCVCKLKRIPDMLPRKFVQSIVIKHEPSSVKESLIVLTVFKFDDIIANDMFEPKTDLEPLPTLENKSLNHSDESKKVCDKSTIVREISTVEQGPTTTEKQPRADVNDPQKGVVVKLNASTKHLNSDNPQHSDVTDVKSDGIKIKQNLTKKKLPIAKNSRKEIVAKSKNSAETLISNNQPQPDHTTVSFSGEPTNKQKLKKTHRKIAFTDTALRDSDGNSKGSVKY